MHQKSLIDRGDNGCASGTDVRVTSTHPHKRVDVLGRDNITVNCIPVVITGVAVNSIVGPIIEIVYQHAQIAKGNSINRSIQMKLFKNAIDETSIKAGGNNNLITNANYVIPSCIKN